MIKSQQNSCRQFLLTTINQKNLSWTKSSRNAFMQAPFEFSNQPNKQFSRDLWQEFRMLLLELSSLPSFRNVNVFPDQVWSKYWNREVKSFWFKILQFWYIFVSAHELKRWFVQEEMANWSFNLLYCFMTVKYYWYSDLSIFNWIELDYCNLW